MECWINHCYRSREEGSHLCELHAWHDEEGQDGRDFGGWGVPRVRHDLRQEGRRERRREEADLLLRDLQGQAQAAAEDQARDWVAEGIEESWLEGIEEPWLEEDAAA